MIQFFKYQGAKTHCVKIINDICSHSNKNRYIEPFAGSGTILFNLEKEFDEYIINDIDKNIISIYNSFRDISYSDYMDCVDEVSEKFGDIKKSKTSYYDFRNWYNDNFHNSTDNRRGIYLQILANSCINSMLRFGPNGMNQSYGSRFYKLSNTDFLKIHRTLNKSTILNCDYKELLLDDSFIFLDPPYMKRPSSYTNNFKENDLDLFLRNIKDVKSDILYTDIYDESTKKYLDWDYIDTKVITNTTPGELKNKNYEVMYMNFKQKSGNISLF